MLTTQDETGNSPAWQYTPGHSSYQHVSRLFVEQWRRPQNTRREDTCSPLPYGYVRNQHPFGPRRNADISSPICRKECQVFRKKKKTCARKRKLWSRCHVGAGPVYFDGRENGRLHDVSGRSFSDKGLLSFFPMESDEQEKLLI